MTTKVAFQAVLKFKSLIIDLINGHGDRTAINQNISIIKRILYMTGTHKAVTIAPPPMVGGLMMKNVDPLDIIFNVPYGMEIDLYNSIIDMMDETIGVLKANPEIIERYEEKIKEKKHQNDKKDSLKVDKTKVFIVHGRDNELKESVARFIEKLGLEAIVLHEQPNAGKTIIEKFENAADVGFAIVLLTPDDEGGLVGEEKHSRARQNVVFELGYFIGRLKRSHVAALVKGNVEIPSDINGFAYIGVDNAGFWKMKVAQELKACGYDIDMNKIV